MLPNCLWIIIIGLERLGTGEGFLRVSCAENIGNYQSVPTYSVQGLGAADCRLDAGFACSSKLVGKIFEFDFRRSPVVLERGGWCRSLVTGHACHVR